MKTCIITGINGQLGQFMSKYLQDNEPDIQIIGTLRHKSYDKQPYIFDTTKVKFELMDLSDVHSITNLIIKYKPEYFVNTAANAYVGESWKVPSQQIELNTLGVLHQLEAIRKHSPRTKYFNMGTSEEFGNDNNDGKLQNETTLIDPKSPYGCAKACSRYLVNTYRRSYNLYALQGWTFNFESELRGEKYVTKKITQNVARIYHAIKNDQSFVPIKLGNLHSMRSWQFCGDVADGIWRQLNQEEYNGYLKSNFEDANFHYQHDGQNPKSNLWESQWLSKNIKPYVMSARNCHSIMDFVEVAFKYSGINELCKQKHGYGDFHWYGDTMKYGETKKDPLASYYWSEIGEMGEKFTYRLVEVDKEFIRPHDVSYLNGDASLIEKELGWKSTLSFEQLVERMIKWDIANYKP